MRITYQLVFTSGLVVVLTAFVIASTTFNSQARIMPLFIGVPVLLLAAYQLFVEIRKSGEVKEVKPKEQPKQEAVVEGPSHAHTLKVYAWTIGVFVAIYLFGFVITTFFYPLAYMKIVGKRSWRLAIGISLGTLVFMYGLLVWGLNVDLYSGVLVLAIRKATQGY